MDENNFNLSYRRKMLYKRKRRRQFIITSTISILLIFPIILTIMSTMKNNNKFVATIYKSNVATEDPTFKVCIDAGHGDWDAGTIGISGIKEKDVDLSIALKLGSLLKDEGIKVMYTRTTDSQNGIQTANDSLIERLKISKVSNSDIFISIHCNSNFDSKDSRGVETWYNPESEEGAQLATSLQNELAKLSYTPDRGVKYYQSKDDALAVLEKNTAPSALVELGFLSNIEDEYYLNSEVGQNACAKALFDGIINYKNSLSDN